MLSQKSVLTVEKNSRSYSFSCDTESTLADIQDVLIEMVSYAQAVVKQAEKQMAEAKEAEEAPVSEEAAEEEGEE